MTDRKDAMRLPLPNKRRRIANGCVGIHSLVIHENIFRAHAVIQGVSSHRCRFGHRAVAVAAALLPLVGALLWPLVSVVLQWPQRPSRSSAER